jgi:hypothetical protein
MGHMAREGRWKEDNQMLRDWEIKWVKSGDTGKSACFSKKFNVVAHTITVG